MNPRYVIRNNYSSAYVHKTLFRIMAFRTRSDALWYMRRNGLNEDYYEVARISEKGVIEAVSVLQKAHCGA